MKFITRLFTFPILAALLLTACAEEITESYDTFEDLSLKAWMEKNHPEVAKNFQEKGGYYVDVLDPGDLSAKPINREDTWVKFDFSGRDLAGNIILTRRAAEAKLAGSYTRYTRYVPFYRYCGAYNTSLIEGTHLALRDTLRLDPAYAAARGLDEEFELRIGSKVTLYLPSRVVGGLAGSGGYEGQPAYELSAASPCVVTMTLCDTIKNPLEREGSDVDAFCESANGGLRIYSNDTENASAKPLPKDPADADHPYNIPERWVSANDTIAQLYINHRFDPTREVLTFPEPYASAYEPYNRFAEMEQKIQKAIAKRFHTDDNGDPEPYEGVVSMDADSVGLDNEAKIWYIGRFLDGFIFDSNIDEVREIIYGETGDSSEALSYTPSEGGMITAFYYAIPTLKFGQWAAVISTSPHAYGASGQGGTSTTSSTTSGYSSYYDYLNYYNYYNSYYGNSYYNNYYNNYYGNYYNSYYNNYNYGYGYGYGSDSGGGTTETVTTVSTEIPSYTPLLFEIYIEPQEEE